MDQDDVRRAMRRIDPPWPIEEKPVEDKAMWIIIHWNKDGSGSSVEVYVDQSQAFNRFSMIMNFQGTQAVSIFRIKDFGWRMCDNFKPKGWQEDKK